MNGDPGTICAVQFPTFFFFFCLLPLSRGSCWFVTSWAEEVVVFAAAALGYHACGFSTAATMVVVDCCLYQMLPKAAAADAGPIL